MLSEATKQKEKRFGLEAANPPVKLVANYFSSCT